MIRMLYGNHDARKIPAVPAFFALFLFLQQEMPCVLCIAESYLISLPDFIRGPSVRIFHSSIFFAYARLMFKILLFGGRLFYSINTESIRALVVRSNEFWIFLSNDDRRAFRLRIWERH